MLRCLHAHVLAICPVFPTFGAADSDPHKIDTAEQFENTRNTVIVRLAELLQRPVPQLQSLETQELIEMVRRASFSNLVKQWSS